MTMDGNGSRPAEDRTDVQLDEEAGDQRITPHPIALRIARERCALSHSALARDAATALGEPGAANALRVRLSRCERGEGATLSADEMYAITQMLSLPRVSELEMEPLLVWSTRTGFPSLALRLVSFTNEQHALDARDAVGIYSRGTLRPWDEAEPVPVLRSTLDELTARNFGLDLSREQRWSLVVLDPGSPELEELVLAHTIFAGPDPASRQEAAEEFADRARAGGLRTGLGPDELLILADQRLRLHGREAPRAWRIEADALLEAAVRYGHDPRHPAARDPFVHELYARRALVG